MFPVPVGTAPASKSQDLLVGSGRFGRCSDVHLERNSFSHAQLFGFRNTIQVDIDLALDFWDKQLGR